MCEQKTLELEYVKKTILRLHNHISQNKKDASSKVALSKQVGLQRKLKKYLARVNVQKTRISPL